MRLSISPASDKSIECLWSLSGRNSQPQSIIRLRVRVGSTRSSMTGTEPFLLSSDARDAFDCTDRYPSITKAAARLGTALPLSRARSLFRMSVAYQNSKHSNQPFDVLRKGWCSASFIALPSELGRELFDRLKRLLSNQFPFPVAGLSLKDANWVRPEIKALVHYLVGSR